MEVGIYTCSNGLKLNGPLNALINLELENRPDNCRAKPGPIRYYLAEMDCRTDRKINVNIVPVRSIVLSAQAGWMAEWMLKSLVTGIYSETKSTKFIMVVM